MRAVQFIPLLKLAKVDFYWVNAMLMDTLSIFFSFCPLYTAEFKLVQHAYDLTQLLCHPAYPQYQGLHDTS